METSQPSEPTHTPATAARRRAQGGRRRVSAIASVALIAAGCGSASPTSSTTPQSPQSDVAAAFKYSSCMRGHGVTNFPDPQVTSSASHQSIRLVVPRSLAPAPQFQAASKACRGILPMPSAAQEAQRQHAEELGKLAFARCLRSHGIRDFPDPTSQGQLTLQMLTAAGIDVHAPAVATAAKACVGASNGTITPADVQRAVSGTQ